MSPKDLGDASSSFSCRDGDCAIDCLHRRCKQFRQATQSRLGSCPSGRQRLSQVPSLPTCTNDDCPASAGEWRDYHHCGAANARAATGDRQAHAASGAHALPMWRSPLNRPAILISPLFAVRCDDLDGGSVLACATGSQQRGASALCKLTDRRAFARGWVPPPRSAG